MTAPLRISVQVLAMVAVAVVPGRRVLCQLPHVAIAALGNDDSLAREGDQHEEGEDAGGS
jgi:hypothetical protein